MVALAVVVLTQLKVVVAVALELEFLVKATLVVLPTLLVQVLAPLLQEAVGEQGLSVAMLQAV